MVYTPSDGCKQHCLCSASYMRSLRMLELTLQILSLALEPAAGAAEAMRMPLRKLCMQPTQTPGIEATHAVPCGRRGDYRPLGTRPSRVLWVVNVSLVTTSTYLLVARHFRWRHQPHPHRPPHDNKIPRCFDLQPRHLWHDFEEADVNNSGGIAGFVSTVWTRFLAVARR